MAALEIAGLAKVWVVAIGTDGTDGPTDAAGAVVDGDTVARAKRLSVDLKGALKRHNIYPALKRLRQLIITGPTGTNVNDLYLHFRPACRPLVRQEDYASAHSAWIGFECDTGAVSKLANLK